MYTNFKESDLALLGKKGKKIQKKKKRKVKISSLKKRVWYYASRYFRKIDALERGDGDTVKCATCDTVDHWTKFDGGHFVAGKNNSVLFEEHNVHCQCKKCNSYEHGNLINYTVFMINHYGKDEVDRLIGLKHIPKQWREDELRELMAVFKQKCEELHI